MFAFDIRLDRYGAIGCCVIGGIVEKIDEELCKQLFVARHEKAIRYVANEILHFLIEDGLIKANDFEKDLGQVELLEATTPHAGLDLRDAQHARENRQDRVDLSDRLIKRLANSSIVVALVRAFSRRWRNRGGRTQACNGCR